MDSEVPTLPEDEPRIGWTWQRVAALFIVIPLAAFWIWAFSPWAPSDKADGIKDTVFLEQAKSTCGVMQNQLAALPRALESTSADDRAEVIASSGPIIDTMIADLRAAAAGLEGRDRELIDLWLADWDTYNQDRQKYAAALRTDPESDFIVSQRLDGQITRTMDGFSRVNDLENCLVPLDV